ncbi:hypothetical protein J7L48_10780 [bacterium]|nr:hypothetical protein [bacterium]
MVLRFAATLILSIFIFYNETLTFALIFLSILILFSFIFKGKISKKFFLTMLYSSLIIFIIQIIFRKGNTLLFQYHFISIYKESIIIGINVAFVMISMVFIMAILQSLDSEVIFYSIEKCRITKFLTIPLYASYRFLPVISHQIKVMRFYALIRIKRSNKGFWQTLKIYKNLLVPLFVSIYKRIYFMSISVERKGISKNAQYFEKKKDKFNMGSFIYLVLILLVIALFFLKGKYVI